MTTMADAAVRQSVLERLARLEPDSRALWGRMTAPEMICHLKDSFLSCLGEKEVSLATGLFQRTFMKWFALNVPFPWPKGVPTRPEVTQGIGGTLPKDFSERPCQPGRYDSRFCAPDPALGKHPHPIFGSCRRPSGCVGRTSTPIITCVNSVCDQLDCYHQVMSKMLEEIHEQPQALERTLDGECPGSKNSAAASKSIGRD